MAVNLIKQYAMLSAEKSVTKLDCSSKNKCKIELKNKKVYQVRLVTTGWLFNYFAVLVLQSNVKKIKVIIAKDAVSQEQFYTLRLYLRSLN